MAEEFDDDEPSTVGWDAISERLEEIYGVQEPLHYGTIVSYSLGGTDPLQGISVYRHREAEGNWFNYVTFGFSELYDKVSDDPEYSGFGFEMTFRLGTNDIDGDPPIWPLNMLQNLARYVFSSGNVFEHGHTLPFNGPIFLDSPTKIHAGIFVNDDLLGSIETPNGRIDFVELFGCTTDEIGATKRWNVDRIVSTMREVNPRLLTLLDRDSILDNPRIAQTIQDGADREGSQMRIVYVPGATLKVKERKGNQKVILTLPAIGVEDFVMILPARLRFGRSFCLQLRDGSVQFLPESRAEDEENYDDEEHTATLTLSPIEVSVLAATVKPVRGPYPINDQLTINVIPKKSRTKMAT